MISIEQYYSNAFKFINSLTIKIDDIRIHQNYHTYVKHGINPPELVETKYYQNMAGIKFKTDYDIYINGELNYLLTRENLKQDITYLSILKQYGIEFYNLTLKNPGMSDYIRGMLNDYTIDEILAIENYTIVNYDKTYLADNEIEIIGRLEEQIKIFMTRYHNKKYMIDELYLPGLLSILYNYLTLFLLKLKLDNTLTYKVDNYHRELFFRSYKKIDKEMSLFDVSTNIWVYGNLNRLKHNIGKNSVLTEVIDDIINRNLYNVGRVEYSKKKDILLEDISDISKETNKTDYEINFVEENNGNDNGITYSVRQLTDILYSNGLITDKFIDNHTDVEERLTTGGDKTNLTHFFMTQLPEHISLHYTNNFTYAVSNFIFNVNKFNLQFTYDYYNSIKTRLFKLTTNDIVNIIIRYLYNESNLTVSDISITLGGVVNDFDLDDIVKNTIYKERNLKILKYMINYDTFNNPVYDGQTLSMYLLNIRSIELRTWYLLSNVTDNVLKEDIKRMFNNIMYIKTFTFNIEDIEQKLEDKHLDNDFLTEYEIIPLLEFVTGLKIDTLAGIINKYDKLKTFFDKVTSYTITLVVDYTLLDKNTSLHSTGVNLNLLQKPISIVSDFDYTFYDDIENNIYTEGFSDNDILSIDNGNISTVNSIPYKQIPCFTDLYPIYNSINISSKTSKLLGNKYVIKYKRLVLSDDQDLRYQHTHNNLLQTSTKSTYPVTSADIISDSIRITSSSNLLEVDKT